MSKENLKYNTYCLLKSVLTVIAWEVLGDPVKRRAFDSIDSFFDDRVPTIVKEPKNFYKVFRPVFMSNSRLLTIYTFFCHYDKPL